MLIEYIDKAMSKAVYDKLEDGSFSGNTVMPCIYPSMPLPTISIIIPTLNSARTLEECLQSIAVQDYPRELLEVIIADAGSTDGTLGIIEAFRQTFKTRIILCENPLKTGEAGKAVGVKKSHNELIALIDSDNVLPHNQWLKRIVKPFVNPDIFGSEPIEYTYRKEDNYITRYCALMGMNDPLCYFLGNYDRKNHISSCWTELPMNGVKITGMNKDTKVGPVNRLDRLDVFEYIKVELSPGIIPTIGANGTVLRSNLLKEHLKSNYLFDIDIIYELVLQKHLFFAKVDIGIIHLFGSDLKVFYRKQKRRIRDFLFFRKSTDRSYPWKQNKWYNVLIFAVCCLLFFPLIFQSIRGFMNKPDRAWFLHPIFCWLTLWAYAWGTIVGCISKKTIDRKSWTQ